MKKLGLLFKLLVILAALPGMYLNAQSDIDVLFIGHRDWDNFDEKYVGDSLTVEFLRDQGFEVNYLTYWAGDEAARLDALDTTDVMILSSTASSGDLNNAMRWDTIEVPIINYEGWAYTKSNFRWCEQGGDMDSITDLSFENYSPLSGRLHSTVKVLEGFGELGQGRMSWGQPHEEGETVPVVYSVKNEKTA